MAETRYNEWGQALPDEVAAAPIDRTQDFLKNFAYTQTGAGGGGELNRFLQGLVSKGFTGDDFIAGLTRYGADNGTPYTPDTSLANQDSFYKYNGGIAGPWGEQARIRAIGSGLDALGKPTGWESVYNRGSELSQQSSVADIMKQNENNTPSDMDDLMDVLKFAGAAGGLYGLGGFLGGAGGVGSALPASTLDPSAWAGFDAALGGGMAESAGAAAGAAGGVGSTSGIGDVVAGGGGGGSWTPDVINPFDLTELPPTPPTSMIDGGGSSGYGPGGTELTPPGAPSGNGGFAGTTSMGGTIPLQVQNWLTNAGLGGLVSGAGSNGLLGLLGKGVGGVLDYMSTSGAADNAKAIADRTWGAGQQYRDNASRAMTPGFDLNSIPGYSGALSTGMDAFNRSLSAKNGNPWGQGGAAGEAISWAGKTIGLPAWQNYFNSNSNAGGLSNLATQSTTAGLNAGAADAATYGSLGQTARNIFDPQPNYQKQYLDLLGKQYGLS